MASGVASENSRFSSLFAAEDVSLYPAARRNGCFRRLLAEAPEFVWMKRWHWVLSPKTEYVFSQRRHFKAIKGRQNRMWYFFIAIITVFPEENEANLLVRLVFKT